jgi:hypothetical protein
MVIIMYLSQYVTQILQVTTSVFMIRTYNTQHRKRLMFGSYNLPGLYSLEEGNDSRI